MVIYNMKTTENKTATLTIGASCINHIKNGGPGSWSVDLFIGSKKIKLRGKEKQSTSNRLFLIALVQSLKNVPEGMPIKILCGHKYITQGIESWIYKWEKNNWKTSSKKTVENKDLWLKYLEASKFHKISVDSY